MQGHVDELELVHALHLAVVAADREGRLTFANDAALSLYGGRTDDLLGHDLSDLVVDTRTPEGGVDALTHVLGGNNWRGDLRIRRADGSSFLAAVVASPLQTGDGHGFWASSSSARTSPPSVTPTTPTPTRSGCGWPTRRPSSAPGTGRSRRAT